MLKLNDIPALALGLVIAAVVIGVGATVTSDIRDSLSGYNATGCSVADSSAACDAIENGTLGLGNLGAKLPLIGTIVALAIVLGVVFTALMFRR